MQGRSTSSHEARAQRRLLQLKEKGIDSKFEDVLKDIEYRDKQDSGRDVAPLRPAEDSVMVDTSNLGFEETIALLSSIVEEKLGLG